MITLAIVKEHLNIDFNDNDSLLIGMIDAVKFKAKTIIGCDIDNPELDLAMIQDVAEMYQSRGEKQSGSETSLATYRRLSKRPMF